MKPSAEIYADYAPEPFYGPSDYGPLLESLGTIVVQVDDSDYQGDSRVLYRDDERWGILLFGWGSCSGCDSLQACSTFAEIDKLRDELAAQIRWASKEATIAWLRSKDFRVESTYHEEKITEFVTSALSSLEAV